MWSRIGSRILDHPRLILGLVLAATLLLGYHATRVQTDHRAGSFAGAESEAVQALRRANETFGRSQGILYVVFPDADPFDARFLAGLDSLTRRLQAHPGVESALSLTNVPRLRRAGRTLVADTLYDPALAPEAMRAAFEAQPFLRGLLLSPDGTAAGMMVKIDDVFNDTPERVDLVYDIQRSARALAPGAALAGFPYLRTHYAQSVTREAPRFTLLALLVSLAFLFLTFGAFRAVALPLVIVVLGIAWTVGLIALFDHRLNIVTGMLPALLVIIGMANTIHLSTKFYDRYELLGERRQAVMETIQTVGLATLLTSLTTAVGFLALLFSGSHLLEVFGTYAAAGILLLYVLSITLLPLAFRYLPRPRVGKRRLATHDVFAAYFDRKAGFTRRHSTAILLGTLGLVVVGTLGAARISSDIFVFSDFKRDDPMRQDLAVFERTFGGVLPMEVVVEAETPGRFRTLGDLRRLEALQTQLDSLPAVERVLAPTDLVKAANQAYFGGNPRAYRLPTSFELPFLQRALGDLADESADGSAGAAANLPVFVDSTYRTARLFLGVPDLGTTRMEALADSVRARSEAVFGDGYDVVVTGSAVVQVRSGQNLVSNLIISLAVALLVISVLMALLFGSLRLTLISLVPNVVPLLIVGGTMGFLGIGLKPSTALIFPLAFGIAVDDTIHFLAKYRINRRTGLRRDDAIRVTLRETGKAILFTSLVLMGGFLVFTLSDFGGTVNLGSLTSLTLATALLTNLILLPALLHRFGPDDPVVVPPMPVAEAVPTDGV